VILVCLVISVMILVAVLIRLWVIKGSIVGCRHGGCSCWRLQRLWLYRAARTQAAQCSARRGSEHARPG
jgi:hypothetical protein